MINTMKVTVEVAGNSKSITLSNNASVEDALNLSGFSTTGLSIFLNDDRVHHPADTSVQDGDTVSLMKKDDSN